MGYEPTMDGMDDKDVKDALETMDRRNTARHINTRATSSLTRGSWHG